MSRPVTLPQLPALPANLDPGMRKWCETMEQIILIRAGIIAKGTNTRYVTIQDLVAAGIVADGVIK